MLNKNLKGFTLIEIIIGIIIFSIVILTGFQALSRVNIGKIKLYTETDIEKQAFSFSEKMFEMIKGAGTIDYEEYFNRTSLGTNLTSTGTNGYMSGHYITESGFGNFGSGGIVGSATFGDKFYYCRSGNGTSMGTGGCLNTVYNTYGASTLWEQQRYGEYYYQFIDYNSNKNRDGGLLGDEDLDGNIIGDDDDEYLGAGPRPIGNGGIGGLRGELYLINKKTNKRTFFRLTWKNDPYKPSSVANCDFSGTSTPDGCIGNIEFLKLDGKDRGMDHNSLTIDTDKTQYDGKIDTWVYDESTWGTGIIAGKGASATDDGKWVSLFPDTLSVKSIGFWIYPSGDSKNSWADASINSAPYIRMKAILSPSRKKRGQIKGTIPEIKISTTIALNSF